MVKVSRSDAWHLIFFRFSRPALLCVCRASLPTAGLHACTLRRLHLMLKGQGTMGNLRAIIFIKFFSTQSQRLWRPKKVEEWPHFSCATRMNSARHSTAWKRLLSQFLFTTLCAFCPFTYVSTLTPTRSNQHRWVISKHQHSISLRVIFVPRHDSLQNMILHEAHCILFTSTVRYALYMLLYHHSVHIHSSLPYKYLAQTLTLLPT